MSEEVSGVALVQSRTELMPSEDVERLYKMAGFLAKGRMFKDVTQAEQAFSKMLIGYHLGLNPAQSMMGIQLVRGNIQMHYTLIGSFVKSRPGYDYKILEHDNKHAAIEFFKDGESLGTATFSVEDAERAKLIKSEGAWETWPENMCVARALSKGVRFFMPEALGGLPVYSIGEIPAQEELTEGEGDGSEPDVALPEEVEKLIELANDLGDTTWNNRSTWKYRAAMGEETLQANIRDAKAQLGALLVREDKIAEAEVVPSESLDGGGATPADEADAPVTPSSAEVEGSAESEPTVQGPDEDSNQDESIFAFRTSDSNEMRQLKMKGQYVRSMQAVGEEEEAQKDEALDMIYDQIKALRETEAQQKLL